MIWPTLQKQIADWSLHNFGRQDAWQPMLGLVEEVAEFMAAREATQLQGITIPHQATQKVKEALEDALADQTIYALNLAQICDIQFGPQIADLSLNVPSPLTDAELMGALGAACHAVLKEAQGIRGYDKMRRKEEMIVALSLWYRWALYQPYKFKLTALDIVTDGVWQKVRRRDWKTNPHNADKKVQDDLAAGK